VSQNLRRGVGAAAFVIIPYGTEGANTFPQQLAAQNQATVTAIFHSYKTNTAVAWRKFMPTRKPARRSHRARWPP
jgi:hypothetical protein